jgi:excisionase family DNA binding protein
MGEIKQASDEVMDYRGLAAYLKTAEGTLRHDVMARRIPFIKIGVRVRFSKREIDKWLESKSQGAEPGDRGGKPPPVTPELEGL